MHNDQGIGRTTRWVACLACLWLQGCLSIERNWVETMGKGNRQSADIQFQDVPVPDGMILDSTLNESYSYEAGAFRYAHLVYHGRVPAPTVAAYLTERLPLHGWALQTDEQPRLDVRRLAFRHLDQVAECAIEGSAGGSRLVIDVSTRR